MTVQLFRETGIPLDFTELPLSSYGVKEILDFSSPNVKEEVSKGLSSFVKLAHDYLVELSSYEINQRDNIKEMTAVKELKETLVNIQYLLNQLRKKQALIDLK